MAEVTVFSGLISAAISNRRLLALNHRRHSSIVEPYALGHCAKGFDILWARQVGGDCESGVSFGWKLIPILEISELKVLLRKYAPVHEEDMPSEFQSKKSVLVNFILTVQSSYSANTEMPATVEAFDTVQFYSAYGKNWLIKTFATDQVVHIWLLSPSIENIVELARKNTEKHYGDVLSEQFIIEANNGLEGVGSELIKNGLAAHLETIPEGCAYWTPEGSHYRRNLGRKMCGQ